MKNKFLALLTLSACLSFAQTATINGQRANFRVLVGSAAPSVGTCDAASERGSIYLRTGDQASVPSQVYVCKQIGASTYGWGPVGWVAQASAPATCVVGDLYFDTDAAAGENLNLCTATNTWTTVTGGGSGDVVGPASATDGCVALYDGPTGKLLQDSTICPDATKNGGVSMLGTTSGEFAFSVANIAGTAVTVIMPTDTSTATAGYALKTTGSTTCPTNLPTGFPSTCIQLEWGSVSTSGGGGLSGSSSINFPSLLDGQCSDQTFTLTGIVAGDQISLGLPSGINSGFVFTGIASATDTVKVRGCNFSGSTVDLASATFSATRPTAISSSSTINFGSLLDGQCSTNTLTLTGAAAGTRVTPGYPSALESGLVGRMHVSAADTVTVQLCNMSGSTVDPASGTFSAAIL